MRLLLDTHAFLWFVLNDPSLSLVARDLMIDPQNVLLISPASYWEVAIKISIGKYQLPESFEGWMQRQIQVNELEILPIALSHAATVASLPFHHKDPFDRLLIAQALTEQIPIISIHWTIAVLDSEESTLLRLQLGQVALESARLESWCKSIAVIALPELMAEQLCLHTFH